MLTCILDLNMISRRTQLLVKTLDNNFTSNYVTFRLNLSITKVLIVPPLHRPLFLCPAAGAYSSYVRYLDAISLYRVLLFLTFWNTLSYRNICLHWLHVYAYAYNNCIWLILLVIECNFSKSLSKYLWRNSIKFSIFNYFIKRLLVFDIRGNKIKAEIQFTKFSFFKDFQWMTHRI